MRKYKIILVILSLIVIGTPQIYAEQVKPSGFLEAYCGSAVLEEALKSLALNSDKQENAIKELNLLADQNKGFNSLYEIKNSAQKAGLQTKALKTDVETLRILAREGQLIANITGNRHFCLIQNVTENTISVYIPGINYSYPVLPVTHFLESWDNIVLLVSNKKINLKKYL